MRERLFNVTHQIVPQIISAMRTSRLNFWYNGSAISNGIALQIGIIVLFILLYKIFPKSGFSTALELVTEKIYEFFEEIMGEKEKRSIKTYVVVLFFIIIISNLLGLLIDFLKLPLPQLEEWFSIPTSNINFTVALSSVAVVIMLIVQYKSMGGLIKHLNEYLPIRGKNILTVERGTMPLIAYYPLKIVVKLFDIGISLFIGFLDIIGLFAKVLSLAARLA